jgi:peptidylprolyl isomerase
MKTVVVIILALIVGIGTALLISLRTPNPLPETGYTEAAPPASPTSRPAVALASGTRTVTPSGLTIIEVKEGTGPAAKSGDIVAVHYRGRLYFGGDQFDSSYDRGSPIKFTISADSGMISGFTEGVTGMKVGGKRELILPPQLAYGDRGQGKIAPNSTLLFDIELMSIN